MTAQIVILDHVRRVLDNSPGFANRLERDLDTAFPDCDAVTVHALVNGFVSDFARKIILAAEVRSNAQASEGPLFRSCIVKIGLAEEVEVDFDGWADVVRDRRASPRLFLSLQKMPLSADDTAGGRARCAVVYQNVSQQYRVGTTADTVLSLHDAAIGAVENRLYSIDSLVRVIREIFQELGQSFYSVAKTDANAPDFYRQKLRLVGNRPASTLRWTTDLAWMRRSATWLTCANTLPCHPENAPYLDPYDYVMWILENNRTPLSFVGAGHGDLHAMNILLDSTGDRASSNRDVHSPTLIDYGDMAMDNLPMWDFVKLETELKVRLFTKLYNRPECVREAFSILGPQAPYSRLIARWERLEQQGQLSETDELTRWTLFVLAFEQRLNRRFDQLLDSDDLTDDRRLLVEAFNSSSSLTAAEILLHAVRRESARWLCKEKRRMADDEWRDEFDFALAVYGLSTSKFPDSTYLPRNRMAALISAGVAIKRYDTRSQLIARRCQAAWDTDPQPSYWVPLFHGYQSWQRSNDKQEAMNRLQTAANQFPTSVPLARECALVLASYASDLDKQPNQPDDAQINSGQKLRSLAQSTLEQEIARFDSESTVPSICEAYDDFEAISRLGRIYKDLADWDWNTYFSDRRPEDFGTRLARQYYAASKTHYRAAFQLSRDHYPGGNYAVTALLCGDTEEAEDAARDVAAICNDAPLAQMDNESQFWVFATEATMAIILQQPKETASYMARAIAIANHNQLRQGLQSTYDQFCRLYCALESTLFDQLLRELAKSPIQPTRGPLTDCGGFTSKTST